MFYINCTTPEISFLSLVPPNTNKVYKLVRQYSNGSSLTVNQDYL